jgi:hypothetical protein
MIVLVRYEIVRNRKFLIAIGVGCLEYGFQLTDMVTTMMLQVIPR